jgi:ABC-type nitrate/sulfonate/bicarbonate transport system substrate-binding protein
MGYAAKGVPAHAVAVVANRANMALVVAKSSGITTIDWLKGKRIGVSTRGLADRLAARATSRSRNWKPTDIEIVPMGEMRTRLAAMRAGQLAGGHLRAGGVPDPGQRSRHGAHHVRRGGAELPHHVVFARDALIQNEADLVRRFLNGWFR